MRKQNWLNNTLLIMRENLNSSHTYSLTWTSFTDMTLEEFKATYLGFRPSNKSTATLSPTYLGEFHHDWNSNALSLPSDWDWSMAGHSQKHVSVVTRVKNQGQCGSCWSFSTTGALEGAHAIANGIDAGKISMSEQQQMDCDHDGVNNGCSGGNAGEAMAWAKGESVCSEQSYPYTGQDGGACRRGCTVILNPGSIWGHYSVPADEDSHCAALVQRPLSVVVDAHPGGAFQHYGGGILNNCPQNPTDHAVLLVGYGYYKGQPYWKIKNSWGAGWGLGGFVLLARGVGGAGSCSMLSGTFGVVVYGKYNPAMQIRGPDGTIVEDKSRMLVSPLVV